MSIHSTTRNLCTNLICQGFVSCERFVRSDDTLPNDYVRGASNDGWWAQLVNSERVRQSGLIRYVFYYTARYESVCVWDHANGYSQISKGSNDEFPMPMWPLWTYRNKHEGKRFVVFDLGIPHTNLSTRILPTRIGLSDVPPGSPIIHMAPILQFIRSRMSRWICIGRWKLASRFQRQLASSKHATLLRRHVGAKRYCGL